MYVVTVRDGLDPLTCAESVFQDVINFVPGEPSYREVGYRLIDGVEHVVFFSANGALYLATQAQVHEHSAALEAPGAPLAGRPLPRPPTLLRKPALP